jgi:drug/metabolite transporter (DMT)-like permease
VVVLLGLLAAMAFALGTVLQQRGTLEGAPEETGARFLLGLLHRPVWLLGGAATVLGWVLQAVALHIGPLLAVQALVTCNLVIALPLGVWLTGQRTTPTVWAAAVGIVVGIVIFLSVGSPAPGSQAPEARAWWLAGAATVVLVTALVRLSRDRPPQVRAAALGAAAGLSYALQAAVTKELTDLLAGGLIAVLTSWEPWVLLAAGFLRLALGQSSLRTGALAPAMAASNAVMLFGGVVLGLTVFGETFGHGGGRIAVAVLGLGLTLAGVVVLARGAPAAAGGGPPSGVTGGGPAPRRAR